MSAHTGALLGVATRGYQLYGADGERLARFEDAGPRRSFALNEGASAFDERVLLCFVLPTIEIHNWKSS